MSPKFLVWKIGGAINKSYDWIMGEDYNLNLSPTILINWIIAHIELNFVFFERVWCHPSLIPVYFQNLFAWKFPVED